MSTFDSRALERAVETERGNILAHDMFGTVDVALIARDLDTLCRQETGCGIVSLLHVELSVGLAVGLVLENGTRCALKVHRPGRDPEYLSLVHDVQRHLADRSIPCPRPLGGPRAIRNGYATLEQYVDGELGDAHAPELRRAMTQMLAELIRVATELPASWRLPRGLLPARGSAWPPPPNAQFSLDEPAAGAEPIVEAGSWLRAQLDLAIDGLPLVTGHCDWSVKNLRFRDGRISAIYDWDSLYRATEPEFVGVAAAIFPMTWYLDVVRAPTIAELETFIAEYEQARGVAFEPRERHAAHLAAHYWVAYNARCEQSFDPLGVQLADSRNLLHALVSAGRVPLGDPAAVEAA